MTAAGLSRIGQISMNARDLDRGVAFYRDALGLTFLFKAPPQMAFFDCGGVRLLLGVPEDKQFDHPGSILYFAVDDIKQQHYDRQTYVMSDLMMDLHETCKRAGMDVPVAG